MSGGLMLLFGLTACSSTDNVVPDAAPDMKPAEAGEHRPPDQGAPGTLAVTVLQAEGFWAWAGHWVGDATKPLAGAAVAADLPGGKRVELTTDASGKVLFQDVAWSAGTAAVTAYAKGSPMHSLTGITKADGAQTLVLPLSKPPTTVTLNGAAKNLEAGGNYIGVGASVYSDRVEGALPTYALQVEAGKPFSLYGLQEKWEPWTSRELNVSVLGWTKADHPGSTAPITLDLDFASKLTPVSVKGTFSLPTSAQSVVGTASRPRFWINQGYAGLIVGVCYKTTLQASGEFSFEGEYLKLPDATGVQTLYFAEVGDQWHGSYLARDGYPAEGAKVGSNFLDVPTRVQPKDGKTPLMPDQPMEWKNPEPTAIPVLRVMDANTILWTVQAKPGTTSLTLPQPPSTAVSDKLLPDTVTARVQLWDKAGGPSLACVRFLDGSRVANGSPFKIQTTFPKTVTVTGSMLDFETNKPVSDGKVCVQEEPTLPCATTTATGAYALNDVPNEKDVTLGFKKTGYLSYAVAHGIHQALNNYSCHWLPTTARPTLESKIGAALDPSKGMLLVAVTRVGATVKLTPAAGIGPVYANAEGWPDPSLTGASTQGWVWFVNLPPGDYQVTATGASGTPCPVEKGWKGPSPGTARVTIQADTLFGTAMRCL
jgi:hypothetical protein